MIKYLKEILNEYKMKKAEKNLNKKIISLESAIDILEILKKENNNGD